MRKRILFLDRDGVLNTLEYCYRVNDATALDPNRVQRLKSIFDEIEEIDMGMEVEIVISSSGRVGPDESWDHAWREKFADAGWPNVPIIGRTPEMPGTRGDEIRAWLVEHFGENFTEHVVYAVVDNDEDMLPEQSDAFIRCDANLGFTDLQHGELRAIFGKMTPDEMMDALAEIRDFKNVFIFDPTASPETQERQIGEIARLIQKPNVPGI